MGDQATNMENKHRQNQKTLAIILNRQLEFLHQEYSMEKLPNNEVFSPPLAWRSQIQWQKQGRNGMVKQK